MATAAWPPAGQGGTTAEPGTTNVGSRPDATVAWGTVPSIRRTATRPAEATTTTAMATDDQTMIRWRRRRRACWRRSGGGPPGPSALSVHRTSRPEPPEHRRPPGPRRRGTALAGPALAPAAPRLAPNSWARRHTRCLRIFDAAGLGRRPTPTDTSTEPPSPTRSVITRAPTRTSLRAGPAQGPACRSAIGHLDPQGGAPQARRQVHVPHELDGAAPAGPTRTGSTRRDRP